jgi:hypothetical protein
LRIAAYVYTQGCFSDVLGWGTCLRVLFHTLIKIAYTLPVATGAHFRVYRAVTDDTVEKTVRDDLTVLLVLRVVFDLAPAIGVHPKLAAATHREQRTAQPRTTSKNHHHNPFCHSEQITCHGEQSTCHGEQITCHGEQIRCQERKGNSLLAAVDDAVAPSTALQRRVSTLVAVGALRVHDTARKGAAASRGLPLVLRDGRWITARVVLIP